MKLQEIVDVMDIKEHWQVWSIIFLIRKQEAGAIVNEQLAEELHIPVTKKFKRGKVYARLKYKI